MSDTIDELAERRKRKLKLPDTGADDPIALLESALGQVVMRLIVVAAVVATLVCLAFEAVRWAL